MTGNIYFFSTNKTVQSAAAPFSVMHQCYVNFKNLKLQITITNYKSHKLADWIFMDRGQESR